MYKNPDKVATLSVYLVVWVLPRFLGLSTLCPRSSARCSASSCSGITPSNGVRSPQCGIQMNLSASSSDILSFQSVTTIVYAPFDISWANVDMFFTKSLSLRINITHAIFFIPSISAIEPCLNSPVA